MTSDNNLPRIAAPCPICRLHTLVVVVIPPDYSVGAFYPGIEEILLDGPEDPEGPDTAECLATIESAVFGDDDEAADLMIEKLLKRSKFGY